MVQESDGPETPRVANNSLLHASVLSAQPGPSPSLRRKNNSLPPAAPGYNPAAAFPHQPSVDVSQFEDEPPNGQYHRARRRFSSHFRPDQSSRVGSHRGDEPHDVNALLQKMASLDPESRQVLKHHLNMYESHDYSSLQQRHIAQQHSTGEEDSWKEDLKGELRGKKEHPAKGQGYESLNYAGHDDHLVSRQHRVKFAKDSGMKEKIGVWTVFILIGVVTGITAFGVKAGEEFFGHWKVLKVEEFIARHDLDGAFFCNLGITTLFVTIAVGLTHVAPTAAGSGVPDVKALLNGVRVRGILGFRVFAVKVLGVIFGVASGLAMGPEGPMIHAGAIIAAGISQASIQWPFKWAFPFMRDFRNDTFKRDSISAGAAAGVASAFGAPIGGLLFSMEEASSFWSHSQTWRTMITCLFATFTMTLLVYGGDSFNDPGLVHFGVAEETPTRYALWEFCMWIPLAVGFGVLGAVFNAVSIVKISLVLRLRKAFVETLKKKFKIPRKVSFVFITMIEAWAVVVILVTVNLELARLGECKDTPELSLRFENGTVDGRALHFLPFECENIVLNLNRDGSENKLYNDFATLSLLPQLEVIRVLFSRDTTASGDHLFSYLAMGIYFPVYFCLVVLTAGLFMPQGLFVPHIVIGALGGRLYGMLVHDYIGSEAHPGTYALMGACGMLAGSTRIVISLAVIMFEITNDIQYLVPIMLVVVVAKNVGSIFNEPYYDELLELRHVPVLEEEPPHKMDLFHVGDLMHPDPICAVRLTTAKDLYKLISDTRHSCFPVVRSAEDNTMIGAISREAVNVILLHFLETRSEENPCGAIAFRQSEPHPPPMTFEDYRALEDSLRTARRRDADLSGVSETDLEELGIDLLPYVNLSTFIVPPTFSLLTCFNLFRSMALRQVIVVNTAHAPIGVLTREELQKHFLYVWLDREDDKGKHTLTLETLNRHASTEEAAHAPDTALDLTEMPAFNPIEERKASRRSMMAGQIENELEGNFGTGGETSFRMARSGAAMRSKSMHERLEEEIDSAYAGPQQRMNSFIDINGSFGDVVELTDVHPGLAASTLGNKSRNNTATTQDDANIPSTPVEAPPLTPKNPRIDE